jgi:hypothetical protein
MTGILISPTSDVTPSSRRDPRRALRLALAGLWLLDAALQYQPVMFTKAFGSTLADAAMGNPSVIANPINWTASLFEHHPVVLNGICATIQLLLAVGLIWRPTVRLALGASIVWSFAIWWLGEGLGGMLSQMSSPINGAPGAVILYALLAVLLWPSTREDRAVFPAAQCIGARTARVTWLVLWATLASSALWPGNRTPWAMAETIQDAASGEPGWLAAVVAAAARVVSWHGIKLSLLLAAVLLLIAVSVYLPKPAWRAGLVLAATLSAVIWVAGEALGGILTGSGTDPNTGPLLILLVVAFWPGSGADQVPADAVQSVIQPPLPELSATVPGADGDSCEPVTRMARLLTGQGSGGPGGEREGAEGSRAAGGDDYQLR